jgi:hypothetical protein
MICSSFRSSFAPLTMMMPIKEEMNGWPRSLFLADCPERIVLVGVGLYNRNTLNANTMLLKWAAHSDNPSLE